MTPVVRGYLPLSLLLMYAWKGRSLVDLVSLRDFLILVLFVFNSLCLRQDGMFHLLLEYPVVSSYLLYIYEDSSANMKGFNLRRECYATHFETYSGSESNVKARKTIYSLNFSHSTSIHMMCYRKVKTVKAYSPEFAKNFIMRKCKYHAVFDS